MKYIVSTGGLFDITVFPDDCGIPLSEKLEISWILFTVRHLSDVVCIDLSGWLCIGMCGLCLVKED